MDVVLLCGGKGTRLSEETTIKPKPVQRKVTKAIGKEINYSKNPVLNDVLKETNDPARPPIVVLINFLLLI